MVKRAMVRAMSPTASSRLCKRRWSWAPRRHSQPEMAASGVMNTKHTMSQHSVRFSVRGPGSFSHYRGADDEEGLCGGCCRVDRVGAAVSLASIFLLIKLSQLSTCPIFLMYKWGHQNKRRVNPFEEIHIARAD